MFYTGGTTGNPKGVMLSHDNLLVSAMGTMATAHLQSRGGSLLHAAPMFHLADVAMWITGMLAGCTHVIVPMFAPAAVAAAISEHNVTDLLLVPTMIQMLVDAPETADADLTSVQRIIYGASPISAALLDRARKRLESAAFTQAYGMTELAPVATLLSPADHQDRGLARAAGRAAVHAEVRIVGPDDEELPRGEVGEVVVRGDNVMLGYWNMPEETAAALRGGWMHTGDAGYLDDRGYLFIVDRLKDMIITGGENVYSAEVENALAKHPAVAACAVIGIPDARWGERVHAVVVRQPGQHATGQELQEFCRGTSPATSCRAASPSPTRCPRPAPARSSSENCAASTGTPPTATSAERADLALSCAPAPRTQCRPPLSSGGRDRRSHSAPKIGHVIEPLQPVKGV